MKDNYDIKNLNPRKNPYVKRDCAEEEYNDSGKASGKVICSKGDFSDEVTNPNEEISNPKMGEDN